MPRRLASSMTASPAGSIWPAAMSRSTRSLFGLDQPLLGRRGVNHSVARSTSSLPAFESTQPTHSASSTAVPVVDRRLARRPSPGHEVHAARDRVVRDEPGPPRRAVRGLHPWLAVGRVDALLDHRGRQVTTPMGSGGWPTSPTPPSASTSMSGVERGQEARLRRGPVGHPQLSPQGSGELVARAEAPGRALEHAHQRSPAMRTEELDELGQGRQRHPLLAPRRRPAHVGDRRRLALHEHGDAHPAGGRLHRGQERADGRDVIRDVGDEADLGLDRPRARRPASGPRRCARS